MVLDRKNKYSYQDCWNYALSWPENIGTEKRKNDIIALCQTVPEKFWSNFSNKSLSSSNYAKICWDLGKYLEEFCPVPYLTNEVFFYGLSFSIEKGVFIPQKDSEMLVEKTLQLADKYWAKKEKLNILDIGTGCGNIIISLAKNKPEWSLVAVDINKKALVVAKNNAELCQVENIQFIESNLFNKVDKNKKFDIIVSNPPYISDVEYKNLSPLTKKQPKEALVATNGGYFFYQEIFQQARNFLAKKFLLVLEVGYQQQEKVIKLIIECFPRVEISICSDCAGYSRVIAIASG